jgi:undecaprenyl-diphosphatase
MTIDNIAAIDIQIHDVLIGSADHILTPILMFLTEIGGPEALIAISGALLLMFWFWNKKAYLIHVLSVMCLSAGTVLVLKHSIQRDRPALGLISETGYSLPSGHALMAFVFFPTMIYLGKTHIQTTWKKNLYIGALLLFMVIISYSRLYLGVHYLSDVILGALIGSIMSSAGIMVHEQYRKKAKKELL